MQRLSKYVMIFLSLIWAQQVLAKSSDSTDKETERIFFAFKSQFEQNKLNNSNHKPWLNSYIVYVTPDQTDLYFGSNISESGNLAYQILNKDLPEELIQLDSALNRFNQQRNDSAQIYIIVKNDLKLFLNGAFVDLDTLASHGLSTLTEVVDKGDVDDVERLFADRNQYINARFTNLCSSNLNVNNIIIYFYVQSSYYTLQKDKSYKSRYYYQTSLLTKGEIVETYRNDIAELVHQGISKNDPKEEKIIKAGYNLIHAYQAVVDSGYCTPNVTCQASQQEILASSLRQRKAKFLTDCTIMGQVAASQSPSNFLYDCKFLLAKYPEAVMVESKATEIFFRDIIKPRLELLPENSEYEVYFAFAPVKYFIPQDSLNLFAKLSYQWASSRFENSGKKVILVTLPYVSKYCPGSYYYMTPDEYKAVIMPGVYCEDEELILPLSQALVGPGDLKIKFENFFKEIPKNHVSYYIYINYEGIAMRSYKLESNVKGHARIQDVYFYVDKRFEDLIERLSHYRIECDNVLSYLTFFGCHRSYEEVFYVTSEIASGPEEYRARYFPIKEDKITVAQLDAYVQSYLACQLNKLNDLKHQPIPLEYQDDELFIGNDNPFYKSEFLELLDILSIPLSFVGLDFITDAVGAIYCYASDDVTGAALYTSALFVPIVTSGEIKAVVHGSSYVYKSLNASVCTVRSSSRFIGRFPAFLGSKEIKKEFSDGLLSNVQNYDLFVELKNLPETDPQFKNFSKHLEDAFQENHTLRDYLNENPEKLDEYFSAFKGGEDAISFLGRMGVDLNDLSILVGALPSHLKFLHEKLKKGGINAVGENGIIKYKTFEGKDLAKIENGDLTVLQAKNSIDEPIKYLTSVYISNHLSKFQQEGGAFVIRKRDITGNSERIKMVERKFVGLKSEMDIVIQRYLNSNKDKNILINELDLGDNYFQEEDEVFYIIVNPNKGFNFDIPTGNEKGAYENFWVPGGYTKHNIAEAVISNSGTIQHNASWSQFVNIFGEENVIQLE